MYDTQPTGFAAGAACPSSHPVRVPQLAYETLWVCSVLPIPPRTLTSPKDTAEFKDMWPKDGSNPFVFSYGGQDGHAYGTHADCKICPCPSPQDPNISLSACIGVLTGSDMFGWKGDALQRAMDSSCMFTGCENGRPLKSQSVSQMNACKAKEIVNENHEGWLAALPGMAA
jgi:hypothetical protein